MSIEKFKTESGETKWRIRRYLDGRNSKRISRLFSTKIEALEFEHSLEEEKRKIEKFGSGTQCLEGTTFEKESQYWLSIRAGEFSPSHKKRVEGVLQEVIPLIGNVDPKYLHAEALFNLRRKLSLKKGRGEKSSSSATLNRKLEVVVAVLNFAAETRRISFYPAAGFRKLEENRGDIEFWERDEAEKFLQFTNAKYPVSSPKRWIHSAYVLALNTAMRAGEIWGLQPRDLKHGSKVLHVQRQWDRVALAFRLPKGRRPRFVPANDDVQAELQLLVKDGMIDRTIFQNKAGLPICHDNFSDRTFAGDIEAAQVPRITFHGLRHTGTTLMIASGVDIKTVQEICGHRNIATTMKYAHLLAESVKNVSKQFSVSAQKPSLRLVSNSDD